MTTINSKKPYAINNEIGVWFFTGEKREEKYTVSRPKTICLNEAHGKYAPEYIADNKYCDLQSGYWLVNTPESVKTERVRVFYRFRREECEGSVHCEARFTAVAGVTKDRVRRYIDSFNSMLNNANEYAPLVLAAAWSEAASMLGAYEAYKGETNLELAPLPAWVRCANKSA